MFSDKIKASVFILTKNNADTIDRTLKSVEDFNDIVICDGGSVDNTLEIAKKYNVRINKQPKECKDKQDNLFDYSCARNDCMNKVKYDFIFYLDSDETISRGLVEDIRKETLEEKEGNIIYKVPVCLYVGNKKILFSSNYPGYQNRFFCKKSGAYFIKPVHEKLHFKKDGLKIKILQNPWNVYIKNSSMFEYIKNNIKYIKIQAQSATSKSIAHIFRVQIIGNFIIFLKIIFKTFKNTILHGFGDDVMPIGIELGRAMIPIILMVFVILYKT
ncbi:MAG TPA: glycosyltransferase, partial [Ignavibacteria bacterium]|nr:glycosyltransferase [Ignavibacteria bacterium]